MICCRIDDGPASPLDYHMVATEQPPERIVFGQPVPGGVWTRLIGSMKTDPDYRPHTYVLVEGTPVAMDDDGEPVYAYRCEGPAA